MAFIDDGATCTLLPEHNAVSSEWEKDELIGKAYDNARIIMVPNLIDLIETNFSIGLWVESTDLFRSPLPPELWNKQDFLAVNGFSDDPDNTICDDTAIQLFFLRQHQQSTAIGNNRFRKKSQRLDKCLLRHEFSKGCYWFAVCKLRRRHQKEIEKILSQSSSLSLRQRQQSSPSSTVLQGLARTAVLKHSNKTNQKATKTNKAINEYFSSSEDFSVDSQQTNTNEPERKPIHGISMLQEKTDKIVEDALSIVHCAQKLEVRVLPRQTSVRWKTEDDFEIRYFQ